MRTKLAGQPDWGAAHEEDALAQKRGLLQPEDQRPEHIQVLQQGAGWVVGRQALVAGHHGARRRDCACAAVAFGRQRLLGPEFVEGRHVGVVCEGRCQLLEPRGKQPGAPESAIAALLGDEDADGDQISIALLCARRTARKGAEPGVALVGEVD